MSFKDNFKMDKWQKKLRQIKENTLKKGAEQREQVTGALKQTSLLIQKYTKKVNDRFDQMWQQHFIKLDKHKVFAAGAAMLGVLIVAGSVIAVTRTDVYQVKAGDTLLGYVPKKAVVRDAVEEIKADLPKEIGVSQVTVDEDQLATAATGLGRDDVKLLNSKQLEQKLKTTALCKAEGWVINIGETTLVATNSKKNAKEILEDVKSAYLTQDSELISADITDPITVTKSSIEVNDLKNVEDAVHYLVTGKEQSVTYTVAQGETLWDIASAHDMSPYDLMALNADLDPAKIQIGQQIKMTAFVPYLNVVTKEKVTSQEPIAFDTVYQPSADLYQGVTQVKTAGVQGVQQTVSEVTKQNGTLIASVPISSAVVQPPQNQVALQGTKTKGGSSVRYVASIKGASYGMGVKLMKPAPIHVSSPFGASRGSRRHTGVDFRNPKGTPIVAAAAGTVTKVGYGGSTGLMVKIKHANGMETWYEHCNSVSVTQGQKVAAGQSIATVGKTGNATGCCLHFEVRINGIPQNPMKYL